MCHDQSPAKYTTSDVILTPMDRHEQEQILDRWNDLDSELAELHANADRVLDADSVARGSGGGFWAR